MSKLKDAKQIAEEILTEIDKSLLLGAALDCMSDKGKASFQTKIEKIIKPNLE